MGANDLNFLRLYVSTKSIVKYFLDAVVSYTPLLLENPKLTPITLFKNE